MQIGDKCIWSLGIEGKGLLRTPLVGGDDSHYIDIYIMLPFTGGITWIHKL